jgi:hypothetical protein
MLFKRLFNATAGCLFIAHHSNPLWREPVAAQEELSLSLNILPTAL